MVINVVKLGRINYDKALSFQQKLFELRKNNTIADVLLLLEHPPLLTLGKRANVSNILASDIQLQDLGIEVFETNRGGDVTYHGPGQIIGYLIMDLRNYFRDISKFMRSIEKTFIELLAVNYCISAETDSLNTGVWVENNKILAIGLSVKQWITMHGFAFNVNTNLEHFNLIIPCGIKEKGVTSLSRLLGYTLDLDLVNDQIINSFCEEFKITFNIKSKEWLLTILSIDQ